MRSNTAGNLISLSHNVIAATIRARGCKVHPSQANAQKWRWVTVLRFNNMTVSIEGEGGAPKTQIKRMRTAASFREMTSVFQCRRRCQS